MGPRPGHAAECPGTAPRVEGDCVRVAWTGHARARDSRLYRSGADGVPADPGPDRGAQTGVGKRECRSCGPDRSTPIGTDNLALERTRSARRSARALAVRA